MNTKISKHAENETVLQCTLSTAYIIEGREVGKKVTKDCPGCGLLTKRIVEVSMGLVSDYNLATAPVFFYTQEDLAGTFKAYTYYKKWKTIKIWLCVFCDSTTSPVSIKVMEDCKSTSTIQGFLWLSCETGYSKKILADKESQLIIGCSSSENDLQDTKFQLHKLSWNTNHTKQLTTMEKLNKKLAKSNNQLKRQ